MFPKLSTFSETHYIIINVCPLKEGLREEKGEKGRQGKDGSVKKYPIMALVQTKYQNHTSQKVLK